MRRWIAVIVFLAIVPTAFLALGAWQDAPRRTLFLNLTTDDPWTNEMALSYAEQVRARGHRVVIFLNVRGVQLARKDPPARLATARARLAELREKGVEIHVCGMCSRRAGMRVPDDWMEGVRAGGPSTIDLQMSPETTVMSY